MKVAWLDCRCILCCREGRSTREGRLSEEHVIPESIGGVLTSHFLCKPCNSALGRYEADLKKDPAVRLVIANLKSQLPELFQRISEGQEFVAKSDRGPAKGIHKNGQFKVSGSRQADGSLILSTGEDRLAVKKKLQKEGATPDEIREAVRKFDAAEENLRLTVAPGLDVIKWTVFNVDAALDANRLMVQFDNGEDRLQGAGISLLKIAYECLALGWREVVFDNILNPMREALKMNDPSLCEYRLEWARTRKPAPFHCLAIEKEPAYIGVQIRLFGDLVYRFQFPNLIPTARLRRFTYTHDLVSGNDECI